MDSYHKRDSAHHLPELKSWALQQAEEEGFDGWSFNLPDSFLILLAYNGLSHYLIERLKLQCVSEPHLLLLLTLLISFVGYADFRRRREKSTRAASLS